VNKGLRRFGILVFAVLSIIFWLKVAERFSESALDLGSGLMILMLGSSVACLTSLVISEIYPRGRRFLYSTRHELFLAAWIPIEPDQGCDAGEESPLDKRTAAGGVSQDVDWVGAGREWIDLRQPVGVEGYGE